MKKTLFLALLLCLILPQAWGGYSDPKLQWKTLSTEHFNINFYEGTAPIAPRLARAAEEIYQEMSEKFRWKPWGKTEIVLTDTVDISNGLATTLPYNYILLFVPAPPADSELNNYENWVEDLFRHEFTHILHLDMYGGIVKPLRWVLGKIVTPNALSPGWVTEGIAVYEESTQGWGRAHSSFAEMMLRTDILNDQFLALDQMAGNQFDWPSYNAKYIYGGMFWQYLADTYGDAKVTEFAHRYSDSLWLFSLNNKARKTFGNKNFFQLHREWKASLQKKYQTLKNELEKQGLTSLQTIKTEKKTNLRYPTLSPDGTCLVYLSENPNREPEIRKMRVDGRDDELLLRGRKTEQFSFSVDGKKIFFNSSGTYHRYYTYQDLYQLELASKKLTKITSGARAFHPDISPDGKTIVYVVNQEASTYLALWDVEKKSSRNLTKFEEKIQFSNPRFSPDGKQIVVSLWKDGQRDLYLYDLNGKVVQRLTQDRAIEMQPVFSKNGDFVYYSSDVGGIRNIHRLSLATGTSDKISNVLTGLYYPQVHDDKVYVQYYQGRGYDLRGFDDICQGHACSDLISKKTESSSSDFPKSQREAESLSSDEKSSFAESTKAVELETDNFKIKKYSPFKKLFLPRYLMPGIVFGDGILLSLSTGSRDPLLRHQWTGGISYRTDANFLGGNFLYSYDRYWPSIFVGFQDFAVNYGDIFNNGQNYYEERSRGFLGASISQYKYGQHFLSGYYFFEHRSVVNAIPPNAEVLPNLGDFAGFGMRYQFSRAKSQAADISLEGGPRLTMDLQVTDQALGSSPDNEQIVFSGDLREYVKLPLEGHVLAFRVAGGIAFGDRLFQGTFRLGSAIGEGTLTSTSPRLFTLRGLPQITFAGDKALLFSGEYRLPLVKPQRGLGTGPIFLSKLYMNFFADYGTISDGSIDFDNFLLGVGAELRGDFVIGYGLPITGRLGYGIIVVGREFIEGLKDPITNSAVKNGVIILELGTSF